MAILKRAGVLFCLVGPAGSGKTSLGARLLDEHGSSLKLSISATSRKPRPGEEEGKSYYFMSREEFQARIDKGEFFEWEETHGNFYGTLRSTVETALAGGEDLLLDIDIRGALNFKRSFPANTVIVFIVAPSPEALRERIKLRGGATPEEVQVRLETAREEYARVLELRNGEIDYILMNDRMDDTYATLKAILTAERQSFARTDQTILGKVCSID